jgi:hypothetical protein
MKTILAEIERKITPGTIIPKPQARADFIVKGWGVRPARTRPARLYLGRPPAEERRTRPTERRVGDRLVPPGRVAREPARRARCPAVPVRLTGEAATTSGSAPRPARRPGFARPTSGVAAGATRLLWGAAWALGRHREQSVYVAIQNATELDSTEGDGNG